MKPRAAAALVALALASCRSAPRTVPAAEAALPAPPPPGPVRLPRIIAIPACYRLVLLDGGLALERESDAEALAGDPASLRIASGEVADGRITVQPAPLPQEIASEMARWKASAARMDAELAGVMERSRKLEEEARRLEALASRIAARTPGERKGQAEGDANRDAPGLP